MPNPTPKPHELSTSVLTPQEYKPGPYTDLRQELHAQAHSRITATLKPGFDVMEIMLELLQWNEQDVEQVWIRPADHVDQASYDITEPSGLETAIQDLLRKVRVGFEGFNGILIEQFHPYLPAVVEQHIDNACAVQVWLLLTHL